MKRDIRIDFLKGIMIYLVVLGHIGGYSPDIRKLIYSFHMPVFVFLSGWLTSFNRTRGEQDKWFRNTFIIYAAAQAGHILMSFVIAGVSGIMHGTQPDVSFLSWRLLIVPEPILWYLVSLIIWRFIAWRIFRGRRCATFVILSVVLALASGFVPLDREFSFQRTFAFLPFFAMGVAFRKENLMPRLQKVPPLLAVAMFAAALAVAYLLPWNYQPKVHYADYEGLAIRAVQTVMATLLCFSAIRLPLGKAGNSYLYRTVAECGKYTLWIYIGHSFLNRLNGYIVAALKILMPDFDMNIVWAAVLALIYCAICIGAAKLVSKSGLGSCRCSSGPSCG